MTIEPLSRDHLDALHRLFESLPDGDVTFIKEDVSPAAIDAWPDKAGERWVRREGRDVLGYAAVLPLTGWSDHVGELRIVVAPEARGRGVGRGLALHALRESVRSGRRKVIVELPAEQDRTIEMFAGLGFVGEALLRDHFRDRHGTLRDLVMLAHFADDTFAAMGAVGLDGELSA